MTRRTQCVVLTLVALLGVKLVLTDAFLRYVHPWMEVPVLAGSGVLLLLALRLAVGDRSRAVPAAPRVTWLLVLPVLAVFCIDPPALGSYAAARSRTPAPDPSGYSALPAGRTTPMTLADLTGRAQWGSTLRDRSVSVTGFVSRRGDHAYVTRMGISCCAADAVVYRVGLRGVDAPRDDTWVRVTGTWVPEHGATPRLATPELRISDVVPVAVPRQTYE